MHNNLNFNPNWASVPGNTIKDLLDEKQFSIPAFADKMKCTPEFIGELICGEREITNKIASNLSRYLGATSDFWLSREKMFRNQIHEINSEQADLWLKELPIADMIKFGWIKNVKDKVTECLKFFQVPDISTWRREYASVFQNVSFRTSPSLRADQAATAVWLRRGEIIAKEMDCKEWNEDGFETALKSIRQLTRKKEPKNFLPELINICAEYGVALVIARTPKGCRASGATKFLNEKRALVLLSFRYLSDDHFWFTFFHEAGHVILHKSLTPIIELDAERDLSIEEKEANIFASEALIPHEMQPELFKLRGNKRNIISFAMKAGVSPGIVIGQMQHRGIIDHKYLNSYKRRYDWDDIISA